MTASRSAKSWSPAAGENPATDVPEDSDGQEECVRLDLTAEEGAMRRIVRAVVVMDYFTARLSVDERDEVYIPRYTAEQAGLQVWKALLKLSSNGLP